MHDSSALSYIQKIPTLFLSEISESFRGRSYEGPDTRTAGMKE